MYSYIINSVEVNNIVDDLVVEIFQRAESE